MVPKRCSGVFGPNNLSLHVVCGDIIILTKKTYWGGDLGIPSKIQLLPISGIGPKKYQTFFPHSVRPLCELKVSKWNFWSNSFIRPATAVLKLKKIRPFDPSKQKMGLPSPTGPPRTKPNMVHKLSKDVSPTHAWPGQICNFTSFILWWNFCDIMS